MGLPVTPQILPPLGLAALDTCLRLACPWSSRSKALYLLKSLISLIHSLNNLVKVQCVRQCARLKMKTFSLVLTSEFSKLSVVSLASFFGQ